MRQKQKNLQNLKMKYFFCNKGELHEGQVLNYVCIDKKCKQKGLICSICKNQHLNHFITPLKFLLSSLKNHLQKPAQTQNFQDFLQKLEQVKNQYLYQLKVVVQNIANEVKKIQEIILKKYRQSKSFLLTQVELSIKYNQIINSALKDECKNQDQFQKDFKMIAHCVIPTKKQNTKDQFQFSLNYQQAVDVYSKNLNPFKFKLNQYSLNILELQKILQRSQIKQLQQQIKPTLIKSLKNQYAFSTAFKSSAMKIENNGKLIVCQKTSSERFSLIEQINGKPIHQIRLKIQRLKHWVGVGIAIKKKIKQFNYNFNYNQLGHGSYLLSNNCYSWSHSNLNQNLKPSTFSFKQGDIIYLEYANKKLKFVNQISKTQFILNIQVNQEEQKDLCFCVNLSQAQDSVSILQ